MSGKSAEIIIQVPQEKFFEVLIDYEKYPEFLSTVVTAEVIKRDGNTTDVYMEVEVIKRVHYTLRMIEEAPNCLSWSMVEGNLFKVNDGSWALEPAEDGAATHALYETDVSFSLFVPKMITNKLVSFSLPQNLRDFKERAESLYASG